MNALALKKKGTAMEKIDMDRPAPSDNQVLVEIAYSAIDTSLASLATKDISSGYIHDMKAKPLVPGYHFSGTIKEIGSKVKSFRTNDKVFGHLQFEPTQRQGAFSEYVVASEDSIALVPASKNVSLPKAAASTVEALTALQAVRDLGGLSQGQSILIIGAGGGVGSPAVGIAKALGAHVTAICSTKDVARVEKMGADVVIDRSKQNPKNLKAKFDVVFDVPTNYSFRRQGMKWLKPGGAFVNTLPGLEKLALGWLWPVITKTRLETVQVESKKADLELVGNWMVDDQVAIDIDSVYNISDFAAAWKRQDDRQKSGRVVIKVKDGW